MKFKRLIITLIIIFILIILMFYSNQESYKNSPQIKKYKQIFNNPEQYNNTEISFSAEIININITNQKLIVSIQEIPFNYPYVEINTSKINTQNLKKGYIINIKGIFHDKNQITPSEIWVIEPWKIDLIYIRSILAIPFILYLFFRTWKFNHKMFYFDRRKKDA